MSRRRAPLELFAPVRAPRTQDVVVEQIADLVNTGRLAEGDLLPGERSLAEAMDVSRGTIRDAIETLQGAGVVTVSPGPAGGIRISSIWVPDTLTIDPRPLSLEQVFELLEARRVVETRVAQLAGLRATESDFAVMRATIELQRANEHDRLRQVLGNARFHRQLWRAARNEELEGSMRSIYQHLGSAFEAALDEDAATASEGVGIDLHEETLAALMRGASDEIEAVMDRHLAYLEARCERHYGRARIRALPGFLTGRGS